MSIEVGVGIAYTTGCCGVRQLEGFSDPNDDTSSDVWDFTASGETEEAAYANLFQKIYHDRVTTFQHYSIAIVQMWFVKTRKWDDSFNETFKAESLRQLVETIPDVVHLGEYNNPNSGNIIKGYQWAVA